MISLKESMTESLITIGDFATVGDARKVMANHWIRHLPVCNKDRFIVGAVSEQVMRKASDGESIKPYIEPIQFLDAKTSLLEVTEKMLMTKTSAYLISENSEVIGIVTSEDLLKALRHYLKEDSSSTQGWTLAEIVSNPLFQKTMNLLNNAGI